MQVAEGDAQHSADTTEIETLKAQVLQLQGAMNQALDEIESKSEIHKQQAVDIDKLRNEITHKNTEIADLSAASKGTSRVRFFLSQPEHLDLLYRSPIWSYWNTHHC